MTLGQGRFSIFGLSLFTLINFSPTIYNHTIHEVTETVTTIRSHIQYCSKVSYQSCLISCTTRIASHATCFSLCIQCNLYTMQPPSIRLCSPLLVFPLEVPYIHPWHALQYTKITLKNSSLQVYTGQYVTVQYFYLVPICPQISHGFFWFGLNSSLMIVKWSSWVASPVDQYK